jgi:hypothetical protein
MLIYHLQEESTISTELNNLVKQFIDSYTELAKSKASYPVLVQKMHEMVDGIFPYIVQERESSVSNGYDVDTLGTENDSFYTEFSQEEVDRKMLKQG